MNSYGVVLGGIMVVSIGLCHKLVIKGEYYWGTKWWPMLCFFGSLFLVICVFVDNKLLSGSFGILGFVLLWSIYELFEQKERVRKGWFPKNPKRKEDN